MEAGCSILAALLSIAAVASPAPAHTPHHFKHHPECRTLRCARHADRAWARRHRPNFIFGAFELCVANREAGEPGSTSFDTINWRYSGDYEGAYNWVNGTWLSMGGGRFAAHAYEATPEQQTLIFRAHANSRDWPQTVPACGG